MQEDGLFISQNIRTPLHSGAVTATVSVMVFSFFAFSSPPHANTSLFPNHISSA